MKKKIPIVFVVDENFIPQELAASLERAKAATPRECNILQSCLHCQPPEEKEPANLSELAAPLSDLSDLVKKMRAADYGRSAMVVETPEQIVGDLMTRGVSSRLRLQALYRGKYPSVFFAKVVTIGKEAEANFTPFRQGETSAEAVLNAVKAALKSK